MDIFFFIALPYFFIPNTLGAISGKSCRINMKDSDYHKTKFFPECECHGPPDNLRLEFDGMVVVDDGLVSPSNHPCRFKVSSNDSSETRIFVECKRCMKEYITLKCYYTNHIDRGETVNVPSSSPEYPCPAVTSTSAGVTALANSTWSPTNHTVNGTEVISPLTTAADTTVILVSVIVGVIVFIALITTIWVVVRKRRASTAADRERTPEMKMREITAGTPKEREPMNKTPNAMGGTADAAGANRE